MRPVYINSASCISSQNTLNDSFFVELKANGEEDFIPAEEPAYKEYIPAGQLRRMSTVVKMSSVAAQKALTEAHIEDPDAIIVGTGMGCTEDSEKFLKNVVQNHEEFLTPTHFIQSTHNTVAGQIALAIQCHAYNFTYVNTSSSLEFSLLDAKLQLEHEDAENILVGVADEAAERTLELYRMNGVIKKEEDLPTDYLHSGSAGVIWGEGASFFVVSTEQTGNSYSRLRDIKIQNTVEIDEIQSFIGSFIQKNGLQHTNIDAVILGFSGDLDSDRYYHEMLPQFAESAQLYFKHLSGEFNTSSGFSFFMANHILKNQQIPEVMKINTVEKKEINNILIYNQMSGKDHSLVLLQKV
ncbi:beta-ketoacyl synthase chain length factor [Chryseobacterium sp.]|uniref:beta-ketoacyl synthase chain length factor n=1 Tax=Chryseobacterium sp. TaxID=1871047 RepID=UPI0011C7BE5E|nr:beta-ketoacyl synthase chain length factor [Chryseobacterium sp.]TXF75811.1 3-oxoacyl-ACP synthase [Chryseobacterium sp.]